MRAWRTPNRRWREAWEGTSGHRVSPDMIQRSHENSCHSHRINSIPARLFQVRTPSSQLDLNPPAQLFTNVFQNSDAQKNFAHLYMIICTLDSRCWSHQSFPFSFNHPPVLKHEIISAIFASGHSFRLCDPLGRECASARKPNGPF